MCLVDVSTGAVTQRFAGHENEVCSVAWNRRIAAAAETTPALLLVASASKDKSIRLWRCDDGNAVKTLQLPKPPADLQKARVWIAVTFHPQQPDLLYSSSHSYGRGVGWW